MGAGAGLLPATGLFPRDLLRSRSFQRPFFHPGLFNPVILVFDLD